MVSLRVCIVVGSLDIVVRGNHGLDKIEMEDLVRIICMLLIWVIAFEFEQAYDRLSYSRAVCDQYFFRFCIGSSLFCQRNCAW